MSIFALAGCHPWRDFSGNNRGEAELRMDNASCQQESQSAGQTDSSNCQNKGCVIGVAVANALAQGAAFNTCMESRGWERSTAASTSSQAEIQAQNPPTVEDEAEYAFKMGKAARASEDYSTAMNYYLIAANKGDSRAQNNIGVMYEKGLGVPKSKAKALKWYRKAAAQGDEVAQEHVKRLSHKAAKKVPATSNSQKQAPKQ
jgi:TPR repeat protein